MHIPALLQFLKELSENNNRPWFLHNKPNYDILREEFTELVADIIQRIAKFDDRIEHVDPKKSLFRIYRDVRFSKDKAPYKTQFSAMIAEKKDHKAVWVLLPDQSGRDSRHGWRRVYAGAGYAQQNSSRHHRQSG